MNHIINDIYLQFTREQLKPHFLVDNEKQINYYEESAGRYNEFMDEHPVTVGMPISLSRLPRQIEKDERFWTISSLKHLFDHSGRASMLESILASTFGNNPPIDGLATWKECLTGNLALYFEAQAPSPRTYIDWLKENLVQRQFIPYILDAASRNSQRPLEGATHFDAAFVNRDNGFSLLIEAKVVSDISLHVSYDNFRNQIARSIDVMIEPSPHLTGAFGKRDPDRSLFALLSPEVFRKKPHSRLYGWLLNEYRSNPEALRRDLPHRTNLKDADWKKISSRLGWITFENIEKHCSGSCPWMKK